MKDSGFSDTIPDATQNEDYYEDNSPILASLAASATAKVQYYIAQDQDQNIAWIKLEDRLRYEEDQLRGLALIYGEENVDFGNYVDAIRSFRSDDPDLLAKWAPEQHYDRPEFPGGLGLELTPDIGQKFLARLLGDDDYRRPDDLIWGERSRASSRIVMEFSSQRQKAAILVGLNSDLDIIFVEETRADQSVNRVDYDWNPDLSLLTLPAEADRLTEQEATRLGDALP